MQTNQTFEGNELLILEKSAEVQDINSWLAHHFGKHIDGRPKYRIALSVQTEKRRGLFAEFYNDIFVRETEGVQEVPKYMWLTEPRWVLEELNFPFYDQGEPILPEVVGSYNGVYEARYTFSCPDGRLEIPPIRAVRFLMKMLLLGLEKTVSDWAAEDEKEQDEDYTAIRNFLAEDTRDESDVCQALGHGEGVTVTADRSVFVEE